MVDRDDTQCFNIRGGSSSKGVVRNITPSNCEKTESTIAIDLNNNPEQENDVPDPRRLLRRDILKEYNGVKVLGNVRDYHHTLKLFEVLYQEDYRMEYLSENEVLSHLVEKEDVCGVQKIPPPSKNSEKTTENKKPEATPQETSTIKRKRRVIKKKANKSIEVGSPSTGIVNNITPSTLEKTQNTNNNAEQGKVEVEPKKLKGREIHKDYNGVKAVGTVMSYDPSLNWFEVLYKEDNRMEYLKADVILSHLVEKEDICQVQQAPPPSNNSEKTNENEMQKDAPKEVSTSKRKRTNTSSKKGIGSSGASSSKVVKDIGQTGVSLPDKRKNKGKSTAEPKSTKKETKTKGKSKQDDEEDDDDEIPTYRPQEFMGLFICKKRNGVKCLGTVIAYSPEKKKLKVRFRGDKTEEYMDHIEALFSMATPEDLAVGSSAPSTSGTKKTDDNKKKKEKRDDSDFEEEEEEDEEEEDEDEDREEDEEEEGSPSPKKRRTRSSSKK